MTDKKSTKKGKAEGRKKAQAATAAAPRQPERRAPQGHLLTTEFGDILKGLPPDHHYQPVSVNHDALESIDIYRGRTCRARTARARPARAARGRRRSRSQGGRAGAL